MNQEVESDVPHAHNPQQSWDLVRTCKLVETVFGHEQGKIVQPCLRSIVDRQWFAKYHYSETNRLLEDFQDQYLREHIILEVIHGLDEVASPAFERLMINAGAHITACIQAMHAVPDILASGVYFALGLNLRLDSLSDWQVNISKVAERVKLEPGCIELAALLNEVSSGDDFRHVAAVSNLSKHRTVIRASLSMDLTGGREKTYEFHIKDFEKKTSGGMRYFPSVSFEDLLKNEFTRIAKLIIKIGNKINDTLESRSI